MVTRLNHLCSTVNAVMELFLSLLLRNVLHRRGWATHDDLRPAIISWIEHNYTRRRRQRRLGKLTPVKFELALHYRHDVAA